MAYKRQIAYVDLIENGIKRGNAGFVKWEKYDECHILSIFINGVEGVCSKEPTVELGNGYPMGKINICHGKGEGTFILAKEEEGWTEEIDVIRIRIEAERELVAEYGSENYPAVRVPKEMTDVEVGKNVPITEEEKTISITEEQKAETVAEEEKAEPVTEEGKAVPMAEEIFFELEQAEPVSLWEELGKTHELQYPFENDRGCYRIFPKDINRLLPRYRMLQNNQFLMHGYYNYRHLILFPKQDGDREYWLGVPGIYHEREKMAARMYGFEKFEGTKREYRVGDMGYYLITVEG